jgi:SAM-dependent methyltransferase
MAVVRSPACGLEWQVPFPDEAGLRSLYGPEYFARWGVSDATSLERVRAMKHATYRTLFGEIRRHRRSGRLLDVGCAAGFLLEVAGEQGFEAFGLDRNPEAVRMARERFGDRVEQGSLESGAFPGVTFDVVTLIDVLEHVADPAELLDAILPRLEPGGVLAAVLPNRASWMRRILGSRWPHYVAEHLYHWSPRNLDRFLSQRGWEVRAIRTGLRKTFTGNYLTAYAARVGSWLPPGLALLGDRHLRIPTGEMLMIAGSPG